MLSLCDLCEKQKGEPDADGRSATPKDVSRPDKIMGAEIAAICQEAGMQAVRKNRYVILPKDFETAYKKHVKGGQNEFMFYQ